MKKLIAVLLAAIFTLMAAYALMPSSRTTPESAQTVVEEFGQRLDTVSLLGPREQVGETMRQAYGSLVAPELLTEWMNDPEHAPGRLTSSPWPDRIEVQSVEQIGEGELYYVQGEIVEVTNEGGGIGEAPTEALRRPVSIAVERRGGQWLIVSVELGAYPGDGEWIYTEPNAQGLQWHYPRELPTIYISAASPEGWPPQVLLEGGEYSCAEQDIRMVGDREYCIVKTSEGAAGSIYTTYEYITAQGDFVARVTFTLRFPQCANYGEAEQVACEAEQSSFDIDGLADRITSSIRML